MAASRNTEPAEALTFRVYPGATLSDLTRALVDAAEKAMPEGSSVIIMLGTPGNVLWTTSHKGGSVPALLQLLRTGQEFVVDNTIPTLKPSVAASASGHA